MAFVTGPVQRSVTTYLSRIFRLLEWIVSFVLVTFIFVFVIIIVVLFLIAYVCMSLNKKVDQLLVSVAGCPQKWRPLFIIDIVNVKLAFELLVEHDGLGSLDVVLPAGSKEVHVYLIRLNLVLT